MIEEAAAMRRIGQRPTLKNHPEQPGGAGKSVKNLLFLSVSFLSLAAPAQAGDATAIRQAREKLSVLEGHRFDHIDYRTPPKLTPDQTAEKLRLVGFLFTEDPYWRLENELTLDIGALLTIKHPDRSRDEQVDFLKDALALCANLEDLGESDQAQSDTRFIRGCVLRTDRKALALFGRNRLAVARAGSSPR